MALLAELLDFGPATGDELVFVIGDDIETSLALTVFSVGFANGVA